MEQKPQENLDDIILCIFEEDDQLVFPITSDRDARKFMMLLQQRGVGNDRLCQEIDEPEALVSSWQKSLKKSALGRKVVDRINQPLMDYLLLESELEYENSFLYVEELDVEGVDCPELICNGTNTSEVSGERIIGRPCSLLRRIKKGKCKRILISNANGEREGQSISQETQAARLENDPSEQGVPLDDSDFSLANSERELDAASGTRIDEHCSQNRQADGGLATSEADHTDCNASASSQPDWDDICDRFLLADESSLYEDIQTVPNEIDQCPDQESTWSLTDSEVYPTEDIEATTSELLYTPNNVDYDRPSSASVCTTNERKEIFEGAMQHSFELAKSDCAFDGFELSLNVDGPAIGDSETVEGEKQMDNVQCSNTLTEENIFETQEDRIGFQPKIDDVREISSHTTFHDEDIFQDDCLLVVPTTPGDGELNKYEANEDIKSPVQTELDRSLSISTATEDNNTTAMTNSSSDAVDPAEKIATASSTFEWKNQNILNVLSAEMKDDRDSLKCASVVEQCSSGFNGTEHLRKCSGAEAVSEEMASAKISDLAHSTPGTTTVTSVKDSDDFSTNDSPAASHEVESIGSVSSIAPNSQDDFYLFSKTETVEFLPPVSEESKLLPQDAMNSADSSPVGGSVMSESISSTKDAKDSEAQTNADSLLLCSSEPFSESSLFQDSEQFQEFQEAKLFTDTSLLQELEHLGTFSLFDRSKLYDEADTGKEEMGSDMNSQLQLLTSTKVDPEHDSKTSISTSLSSEETSQEQPGYIYVFSDGCNSSKVQRFKVGSVSCPYEELQRAKMFNVDIKLVSATAHPNPERAFQQIKSRLEQWKMEGKEDWFLCPSTVVLQTITEVVNTHL